MNEVKPPQHDGTPRSHGIKWTLSASVNHVSGCCQDFVVVIVVTDSSSSRVMRYDAFGNKASRSRFLSGETLPTMRQHSSTIFLLAKPRFLPQKPLYALWMSFAERLLLSIFFRMIRRQINARNSAWHKVAFWTSRARCLRNLSTASRESFARMIFARPVLAFSLSLNSLRAAAALNRPMHPSITRFTISLALSSRHVSLL